MRRLENVYAWLLLIVFGGIVLHAPLSVALSAMWLQYAVWFKSWKELLLLVAAIIAVIIITRRQLWRELFADVLVRIIAAYTIVHLILVVMIHQGTAATLAGLAIDLRYVLYFALVYVLLKFAPQWRRPFLITGAVGAAIVVAFATIETVLPRDFLANIGYSKDTIIPYLLVDQNPHFVRYNSTLRGPNPLGAYTIIVLAAIAALLVKGKIILRNRKTALLTGVLIACSIMALWVSYSRSAGFGTIFALLVISGLAWYSRLSRRGWIIVGAAVVLCVFALAIAWKSSFISNIILHVNPNGGGVVNSNMGHAESLKTGIVRFAQQPLGAGVGSTGSASLYGDKGLIIENQYLYVAHEAGWVGLGLFIALWGLILARLWRARDDWLCLAVLASGLGLAVVGLLLPVWADDTVSIVWWGLAALALGSRRGN